MTTSYAPPRPAPATPLDPAAQEGWQALAAASLGRLLTDTELAAVEHLPTELALDLLFPGLGDPARHEALSTLP
jgi:hypothetical protein